ncbi:ATP-dependent endonuclease [Calidifontibacter sp. DB0510]|uniref:ATP-dependent endonuclease n=1 Tax=Metallococcus carri TaxID=1656884 RepID=A0A967AYS4_9MICO|nr:ATP-dependent endonuclease [Metallococcus carri]NHN54907.1 ATP-dependent endonuclease [Metallococcus carri]NOP37253.1 ATP-dependent endonuclease [Calidifontibacter sp. DB2511S]
MPTVRVLVEGDSDAVVVARLLTLRGVHDVEVRVTHGITNFPRHLRADAGTSVLGLCDAGEQQVVVRALRRLGIRVEGNLVAHGFFVCNRDLEDELIRSLGAAAVLDALHDLGELGRFRTFQHQPEWRGRPIEDQLHRFAGSGSGRKRRLATALAERLTPETTPQPLGALVEAAARVMVDQRAEVVGGSAAGSSSKR